MGRRGRWRGRYDDVGGEETGRGKGYYLIPNVQCNGVLGMKVCGFDYIMAFEKSFNTWFPKRQFSPALLVEAQRSAECISRHFGFLPFDCLSKPGKPEWRF